MSKTRRPSTRKTPVKKSIVPQEMVPDHSFELPESLSDNLQRLNAQRQALEIETNALVKGFLADKGVPQNIRVNMDPQSTVLFVYIVPEAN